jgi:hypothetical protein
MTMTDELRKAAEKAQDFAPKPNWTEEDHREMLLGMSLDCGERAQEARGALREVLHALPALLAAVEAAEKHLAGDCGDTGGLAAALRALNEKGEADEVPHMRQ